jgi:hypothetical protein
MTARLLMLGASAVRLAVGAGYLLAPARMAAARLAPETEGHPDARLFVRGFGGHQLVTAAMTLAATRTTELVRPALVLSLLIDLFDVTSAGLEIRARGRSDTPLVEGIAFSGAGLVSSAVALRALHPGR